MLKITLKIDGMMCGMCESHINDTLRKNFAVKRVTSSHSKGKTEIITENPIPEEALAKSNRRDRLYACQYADRSL